MHLNVELSRGDFLDEVKMHCEQYHYLHRYPVATAARSNAAFCRIAVGS
jgi:hypothetical protein